MTRPAIATLVISAVLLLAAGAFDLEPLYVPGVVLAVIAITALIVVVGGTRGVVVTRDIRPLAVVEGDPVRVTVTVTGGTLGLPTGTVAEPLLRNPVRLKAGRSTMDLAISATFDTRGRRTIEPSEIAVRDPFGLAERRVVGATGHEVLVLPRPAILSAVRRSAGGLIGARSAAGAAGDDLDLLRPHVDGGSAARIVWPVFARTGELVERRMIPRASNVPLLVLDPRNPSRPADLDDAVRAIAGLAVRIFANGSCAVLLPGSRRPDVISDGGGGWGAVHAQLAVVGPSGAPAPGAIAAWNGPVVWVSAQRITRLPGAAGARRGGGILVVPGAIDERTPAFRVGACSGYTGAGVAPGVRAA